RVALAAPLAGAVVLAAVIFTHREKTTGGELLTAVTLSLVALPIALAARAPSTVALTCVLVFALCFIVATVSVRAVILWARGRAGIGTRVTAGVVAAGSVAALAGLARAGVTAPAGPWAAIPVCTLGLLLVLVAPSPRHLRTIGWSLVAATALTAIVLIAALR
ncbi:MAG: hypothetical protein KGN76_08790, partial [Acidobacteriota bacterium]|nr:hypothetical protein [Acidobacteriota bacterium]